MLSSLFSFLDNVAHLIGVVMLLCLGVVAFHDLVWVKVHARLVEKAERWAELMMLQMLDRYITWDYNGAQGAPETWRVVEDFAKHVWRKRERRENAE